MLKSLLNNLLIQGEILSYLGSPDQINLWHAFQDDSLEFNYPLSLSDQDKRMTCLPKITKLAIEAHKMIDYAGSVSAIRHAINAGKVDIINFLLDSGVDVNYDHGTYPPIMAAVCAGLYHVAKLLLKRGADPNKGSYSWRSPIMEAAHEKRVCLFGLLLKHGASLSADNVVQIFEWDSQPIITILIVSGINLNVAGGFNVTTPLIKAVQNENYLVIFNLLKRGVDVNYFDNFGCTALALAITRDRIDLVELLLQFGADINAVNSKTKVTILEEAIKRNNPKILKLLQK